MLQRDKKPSAYRVKVFIHSRSQFFFHNHLSAQGLSTWGIVSALGCQNESLCPLNVAFLTAVPLLVKTLITPHNVGSVLWRLFSTLEVVQYIGGIHQYCGGIASVLWGIASVLWRDSFSTVEG